MSDDENDNNAMLPSPSYVPSDEGGEEAEEGDNVPASPPRNPDDDVEQVDYKWYAYYDDERRVYYYNTETQETSWDAPEEGFYPPPEGDDDNDDAAAQRNETTTQGAQQETGAEQHNEVDEIPKEETDAMPDESTTEPATDKVEAQPEQEAPEAMETEETPTTAPESSLVWVAYQDDEGREYYYNTESGETTWEKPDGFVPSAITADEENQETAAADAATTEQPQLQQEEDAAMGDAEEPTNEPQPDQKPESEPEPKEEIDPEVLKLQQAQAALDQPDSVLERTCIANVTKVTASNNGNPDLALGKLVENYEGQTAVCGLLGQWLCRIKAFNKSSATKELSETTAAAADDIRETIQEVLNRVAKENFDKDVGDGILNLSREDAHFLQDMIDSSRWRKLLIDLSASHKESAVLKLCLKMISSSGHHREIARRINQSDHFSVFSQMLQSELTAIGRLSVSAGSDTIGFTELVQDLERACTSTSYTYLYSLEMIRALLARVKNTKVAPRFQRAVRKWEVLAQVLEETLVDPASISSSSSPLFRKRRLDVALTIDELHQRQRKRHNSNGDSNNTYEQALLSFLRRHASGIQVADSLLDPLLPSGLDLNAGKDVGNLLTQHPLSIRALLGHLYKPGQTRVTNPVTKNKCARLIALSVLAAEEKVRSECQALNGDFAASDEVALTRTILQGAQLCEQLESMISFLVVSTSGSDSTSVQEPGQKLVNMAQDCAAVAQGVMMWAKEFTSGSGFSGSASFPTLSGCILSLVRVVAIDQPFTRKQAIEIAIQFLGHSNSDVSYQKVSAIKEQSLRLLVFLMVKGEVVGVLEAVMKKIAKKGTSDLDASLIRYFVAGVVGVVKPPTSFVFARLFVKLVRSPPCVDAVRSKYFDEENRAKLGVLLKSFQTLKTLLNDSISKEDQTLFDSAVTLYQVEP